MLLRLFWSAERFLRTCASAHAERYPRADDSDGTVRTEPSFYARASALLSAACLRGPGDELRSRVLSSVSRASLRWRAPADPVRPLRPSAHKRPRLS
ncbi:hypothetical protein AB1Y20_002587 [Prymnesium parvum]|uniref:Uncharacterized protein n=1 Tax=Prymnesium parvum TaxID=97485 RepID=A0AB34J9P5_PRYPA